MSVESPVVSIIIPNYNHSRYLRQRIDSVLSQTFSEFEIFLLDDYSQDDSREILEEYALLDKRITVIYNEKNSGAVFKQWAKGLSLAKGKYVWIAESDDFAERDFLNNLVSLLEKYQDVVFAYSNSWIVDEHNAIHGTTADWKNKFFGDGHWEESYVIEGKEELQKYLSIACTVNNASSVLFRRSSIDVVGGVDSSFRYTGDWLMYIKLSMRGRIAYYNNCLSNYREHSANASKSSLIDGSQLFERLKCFAFLYRACTLNESGQNSLLSQASVEFATLQYDMLRRIRRPFKLLSYIKGIATVSFIFYLRIQIASIILFIRNKV